jgi:rare lipoprotein A
MYAMTAAHKTMPLPSYARVRNPANGREVVVRVNDRGPFHSDRVIDLSYTAALKLGLLGGVAPVEVERITYEAIRTGAWRARAGEPGNALTALQPPETAGWPADDPIAEIARRSAATPIPTPAKPAGATAQAIAGFWLQLGAFGQRDGALGLQQKMALEAAWLSPLMAIFNERNLHRLQAGPYASRADATRAAERLREALSLLPTIVDRR